MVRNYYIILDVDSNATQQEIKAAYRQKVKELHPDHYGEDSQPFLVVQEAYAVLNDPVRRRAYDDQLMQQNRRSQTESRSVKAKPVRPRRAPVEPLIPAEDPAHPGEVMFQHSFHDFQSPFEAMFDRLRSTFTPLGRFGAGRIEEIRAELVLSPEQAWRGGRMQVSIPLQVTCPTCRGRGSAGPYLCWYCSGEGTFTEAYPLQISIPAGVANGAVITVSLDRLGIYNTHLTIHLKVE